MAEPERPHEPGAVSQRISQELAAIHEESYGVPPRAVTAYLLDDAVLAVMEIDLLKHEHLMVERGRRRSVHELRTAFQEAIETTFAATVEHLTGRRVVGFLSDTHLDPPFTIEFFKLTPAREPSEGPGDLDRN